MRTFIAIPLPDNVKKELTRLQKEFSAFDFKAAKAKEFHLTLKFLGEVKENNLEKIKKNLASIQFEPFEVSLANIGFFPTSNYIRVVWIGLEPHEKINELQKKVDESLKQLFKPDLKFHPHLTLFRVKFIKNKEEFHKQIGKIEANKISFKVGGFNLYKSTLTPEGSVYEELAAFTC